MSEDERQWVKLRVDNIYNIQSIKGCLAAVPSRIKEVEKRTKKVSPKGDIKKQNRQESSRGMRLPVRV